MMAALKIDAVRGPVAFDDMRNPVHNIYIKKVEKKKMFGYDKDELWNTVIKTYPNVSQFWTYGKETFLKQPVYSRDFPPCKYLPIARSGASGESPGREAGAFCWASVDWPRAVGVDGRARAWAVCPVNVASDRWRASRATPAMISLSCESAQSAARLADRPNGRRQS